MINSIIVGRGSKRTVIALPRDRDIRHTLGNKIKGHYLFPSTPAFKAAKLRGDRALAAA